MKRFPLIYVAGPISKGWLPDNIRHAVNVAEAINREGAVALVPHTHGTLWELMSPHDHAFWMRTDCELIHRCDGLVRIPGDSTGANEEVTLAAALGLEVFSLTFSQLKSLALDPDQQIAAIPFLHWVRSFSEPGGAGPMS